MLLSFSLSVSITSHQLISASLCFSISCCCSTWLSLLASLFLQILSFLSISQCVSLSSFSMPTISIWRFSALLRQCSGESTILSLSSPSLLSSVSASSFLTLRALTLPMFCSRTCWRVSICCLAFSLLALVSTISFWYLSLRGSILSSASRISSLILRFRLRMSFSSSSDSNTRLSQDVFCDSKATSAVFSSRDSFSAVSEASLCRQVAASRSYFAVFTSFRRTFETLCNRLQFFTELFMMLYRFFIASCTVVYSDCVSFPCLKQQFSDSVPYWKFIEMFSSAIPIIPNIQPTFSKWPMDQPPTYQLQSKSSKYLMQPQPVQPRVPTPLPAVSDEHRVGITEYLNPGQQLFGITKYLISDFVVNEIEESGAVVAFHRKPDLAKAQQPNKQQQQPKEAKEEVVYEVDEILGKEIVETLGKQAREQIEKLYQRLTAKEKVTDWEVKIPSPEAKEDRQTLHKFIREKLHNIDSKTESKEIVLNYCKTFKRVKKSNDYIHFKLLKSNIDTMSALFKLSKIMGVNQKLFGAAGLKDKRGVTTQLISLYNCQRDVFNKFYKVAFRNKQLWVDDIEQHKTHPLALGQLQGNRFGIVIRFFQGREIMEKQLLENLQKLKDTGFINYFGMQRFGRGDVKTHMTGIEVLKKNWKGVVQSLLFEDTHDRELNALKKQYYEKGEYKKAQRMLNYKYGLQKNLFNALARYGTNYCSVFESLPRNSRMIYGHALQSYIWNIVASKRIKDHGPKVIIGDYVAQSQPKQEKVEGNLQQGVEDVPEEEVVQEVFEVVEVTADSIHKYNIFDIVVPLVGSRTVLSETCLVKGYIQHELSELGLTIESFVKGMPNSLRLEGGHRKLISQAANLNWAVTSYNVKNEQLQNGFYYLDPEVSSNEGKYFAVKLRFDLLKSSYATMLMREVLKIPSSFDVQEILNKQYNSLQ